MKRVYVIAALLLVVSVSQAQRRGDDRKDQIEAQRSAYITSRIGLNSEESRDFWPVYNRMRDELEANRDYYMRIMRPRTPMENRSDAEVKEAIEARFKMEEEKIRIERKYQQEFLKVLSIRKVAKLYQAEEEFKREVLKELKRR